MNAEMAPSVQEAIEEALRRLVANPETRDHAVEAIERAVDSTANPEWQKMRVLAWIHRRQLLACVRRLEDEGYQFDSILDDSPEAHRRVADIQRILAAFGFDLGPDGVDGYSGGPPGRPVALDLEETSDLARKAVRQQKLLSIRLDGGAESWTRDATRRLQLFLGRFGLVDRPDLRIYCLARPDGLFGALTLAGLSAFLADVVPTDRGDAVERKSDI